MFDCRCKMILWRFTDANGESILPPSQKMQPHFDPCVMQLLTSTFKAEAAVQGCQKAGLTSLFQKPEDLGSEQKPFTFSF